MKTLTDVPTGARAAAPLVVLATLVPGASAVAQADVDLPTGVRMHVEVRGPVDAPALVLLHGYSDSGFSFSRVMSLLPDDRRIIVPDLRGHGRSSQPAAGYGMDLLARDVLALLDALEVESAVVLGHSMGSFVAQRMAVLAPERVDALVLVGSAPSIHGMTDLVEFRVAVDALAEPVQEEFVRAFQQSTIVRPVPPEFMQPRRRREPAAVGARLARLVDGDDRGHRRSAG